MFPTDLGATAKLYAHIAKAMPRVTPHYAVKCFPEPGVMATLAACGAGFDCASAGELAQVLALGVNPARVIFANPCKRPSDLAAIKKHGVPHTTFDGAGELDKIAARAPGCGCVLRIRADDTTARMPFGVKYGALPGEVPGLLARALELGLAVAGVSFHVGSGAGDPNAFRAAIAAARGVRDQLVALDPPHRARPFLLDLGGGFSGGFEPDGRPFVRVGAHNAPDAVAHAVNAALDEFFPEADFAAGGLRVISEPGRYFAEASAHIVARVFGKRERLGAAAAQGSAAPANAASAVIDLASSDEEQEERKGGDSSSEGGDSSDEEGARAVAPEQPAPVAASEAPAAPTAAAAAGSEVHYYLSDGIYGGMNALMYDGWLPRAVPFRAKGGVAGPVCAAPALGGAPATVFGPTCDSLDMVFSRLPDCPALEVGDFLLFPASGAYTAAGAVDFNGIPSSPFTGTGTRTFYVRSADMAMTADDKVLPTIFSETPPLSVRKNY